MPLYDYRCRACHHTFEATRSIAERDYPTRCPECGNSWFAGALFLMFLGLKLAHIIDWSWWWVFAPLWGPLAAGLIALALIAIVAAVSQR
jgi:putative FmdB family regulatory protein